MENHSYLLEDPIPLVGNCGVCREEKEARGTAVVIFKKKKVQNRS